MSYRADSTAGRFAWETEPLSEDELKLRNEEIAWLIEHERPWRLHNGRLIHRSQNERGFGPLAMAEGTYGALAAYPPSGSFTGIALTATEASMITAQATYLPIPANGILAPQAYRYVVAARYTVTTTPGSLVTTVRLGNANTSPSLGASAAVALTASLTNAFIMLKGDLTIRSIGLPGANSTAWGTHDIKVNTAVGGAYNAALWGNNAAVSFDSSLTSPGANGGAMWIGMNDSGATNHATVTVDQVHFMDWN